MGPRGAKGNTALHIAVKLASVAMVKALLVFEADTAAKNEEGLTPWQLAKKKWDASGVMDVMKDREGVLFAMHAVGAEGAGTDPGMYVRYMYIVTSDHSWDYFKSVISCHFSFRQKRRRAEL